MIFVLAPAVENPWYSCRVIEEGMDQALGHSSSFEFCRIPAQITPDLLEKIKNEASALFITSTPLLSLLADQLAVLREIPLLLPVFGDMTIETRLWTKLGEIFKNRSMVFLGASTRQCQQLSQLVNSSSIKILPYPLPDFWFEPLIEKSRDQVNLVYSGRLTPQKNVLELMSCFLKVSEIRSDMRLHIAGDFHEIGHHFHGIFYPPGDYQAKFYELVKQSHGKIIFHGFLSQEKLRDLYDGSDVFVSLSTYHDEDFGVSAAQAISRGLRAVLSDWGGHWDFADQGLAQLCKVEVGSDCVPRPSQKTLLKVLVALSGNTKHEERLETQKKLDRYMGQKSYFAKLVALGQQAPMPYEGQSALFLDYAARSEKQYVFAEAHGERSREIYHAIYDSYLSTHSDVNKWR